MTGSATVLRGEVKIQIISDYGVEGDDHLTDDGGDGDLVKFGGIAQALVEGFESWVEAHGDDGGHVESFAKAVAYAIEIRAE